MSIGGGYQAGGERPYRRVMSTSEQSATSTAPKLGAHYATALPELVVPWHAAEAATPGLLILNEPLAAELGLDPAYLRSEEGVRLLVGNHVPDGATPAAQAYAGHQFGGYSPRLGDGRALLMGELADGRDLHLKGSGRTPFARGGDGQAGVGPMLREYVISEAMHALGVPTTRSLAVTATGNTVYREQPLPGAVLARVAAGHERVGTFQFARALAANSAASGGNSAADGAPSGAPKDDHHDDEVLRRLADHAITRHHPNAAGAENPYLELFTSVLRRQADLVARWMLIGFIHGVMNTDNTTISGETIDYGPCAFMESYDPATVFSSIDTGGRYAYGNQPGIVQWNLARFAETLIPLVAPDQDEAVRLLTEVLGTFPAEYERAWNAGMRAKLGLGAEVSGGAATALSEDLLALLATTRVDFTNFFRHLTSVAGGNEGGLRELFAAAPAGSCSEADPGAGEGPVDDWLARWRALDPSATVMAGVNPVYIPRNHLVEEALDAATAGDTRPFSELLVVVTDPYTERPGLERFAEPAPVGAAPHVTYCGT